MPKGSLRTRLRSRVALCREARGLTQAELAERLGVSKTTVARWETDGTRPAPAMIGLLARTLRCRPGDLFPHDYA